MSDHTIHLERRKDEEFPTNYLYEMTALDNASRAIIIALDSNHDQLRVMHSTMKDGLELLANLLAHSLPGEVTVEVKDSTDLAPHEFTNYGSDGGLCIICQRGKDAHKVITPLDRVNAERRIMNRPPLMEQENIVGYCPDVGFFVGSHEECPSLSSHLERWELGGLANRKAKGYPHRPVRDSGVEQYVKENRDSYRPDSPEWIALDNLLDDYRLRADTGTALNDLLATDLGDDHSNDDNSQSVQVPTAEPACWEEALELLRRVRFQRHEGLGVGMRDRAELQHRIKEFLEHHDED